MDKDKVPFYPSLEDFDENLVNSYHPEAFDLLNYYQVFDNNDNKNYDEEIDQQDNSSTIDNHNYNNGDPNYPGY